MLTSQPELFRTQPQFPAGIADSIAGATGECVFEQKKRRSRAWWRKRIFGSSFSSPSVDSRKRCENASVDAELFILFPFFQKRIRVDGALINSYRSPTACGDFVLNYELTPPWWLATVSLCGGCHWLQLIFVLYWLLMLQILKILCLKSKYSWTSRCDHSRKRPPLLSDQFSKI